MMFVLKTTYPSKALILTHIEHPLARKSVETKYQRKFITLTKHRGLGTPEPTQSDPRSPQKPTLATKVPRYKPLPVPGKLMGTKQASEEGISLSKKPAREVERRISSGPAQDIALNPNPALEIAIDGPDRPLLQ